jgi:class 3 adenylate cyclase
VSDQSLLERGRDALERHDWRAAYETLSEADRRGGLSAEGLGLLARAAYWIARPDETVGALERSFAACLEAGDVRAAAMAAFRVAEQHGMRMSLSQAQGWAARAMHLAEGHEDWPVQGWLIWMHGLLSWFEGNFVAAVASYEGALQHSARSGDRDLHAMSLHDKGHALCLLGRVGEGMRLLDEAMVSVVGGELDPDAAGYVYCGMIGICSKLGDYRRASEWTTATLRWCERESVPAFPGVCRIHKAELLRLAGSFAKAEEEARLACEELPRYNFSSGLGPANYEIGEIRRRLGDVAGAEEAYARANEFGFMPQPGLSLLRLAEGRVEAAMSGIRQALAEASENHCLRVRLLAAQTGIALAAGDVEAAAAACDELGSLVGEFGAASMRATACRARGSLLLARGDAAGALAELREARRAWQEVEAPYEVAEVRLLLAVANRRLGDEDAAVMEAGSARRAFEHLGAQAGAAAAAALLAEAAPSHAPRRLLRGFMFTDIVKSTDLVGVIGDEAWEHLLAWHDQELRSLFASHGGRVAHHTGDGFFVAFDDAHAAVDCAIAVQRALADHRRAHGFAPQVRIGVHVAEATRRGDDYSGVEVHRAARIAALAGGDEILATASTATAAGLAERDLGDTRAVSLKGFAEPVDVRAVRWRDEPSSRVDPE